MNVFHSHLLLPSFGTRSLANAFSSSLRLFARLHDTIGFGLAFKHTLFIQVSEYAEAP
jgi:hypothetical protein